MKVTRDFFAKTSSGSDVHIYHLTNAAGARVDVLDFGCVVQSIVVPDRHGDMRDVCLGYDDIAQYEGDSAYFGAIVGRHANRIEKGKFTLNGKEYQLATNNGPNHLHGGNKGFNVRVFDCDYTDSSIEFRYLSPDGEEGYPGNLEVKIVYDFTDDNELVMHMTAESDADTVVNLANHAYFNLEGDDSGDILDHELKLYASQFTENDADCLPTGVIADVDGTPFDFREAKVIGRDIDEANEQLKNGRGYDHNFVLGGEGMKPVAEVYSPVSGILMKVHTTLPGVQFYSGNFLTPRKGKKGASYDYRDGLCLETQFFPNGMAHPHFPSPILKKGEAFDHTTIYKFETKN